MKQLSGLSLKEELSEELNVFLEQQLQRFPKSETLKMDLHCHDYNSDVPDELIGRILNVPETWLKTEKLFQILKQNGAGVFTVTNHNNARSCYQMQEKGFDVLTGAEFSCFVPDYNTGIHVLAYGFNFKQENELNRLRKNLYSFLQYAKEQDIPTIWAHPLYHYHHCDNLSLDFFEKMLLIFERFEVLNGQRDNWQNMLVKAWLDEALPEKINLLAKKHQIQPERFCNNPYKKIMCGGSDSHNGLFAAYTGSLLYIPDLKSRLKNTAASELALEAIKYGRMVPYGLTNNSDKLTIALLDYVCQVAINYKDPGLLRLLLHKGDVKDKIIALLATNAFSELQHHKVTMNFIKLFHSCLGGKKPKFTKRWFVPKVYKPVFDDAKAIAGIYYEPEELQISQYQRSINHIYHQLNQILFKRLQRKIKELQKTAVTEILDFNTIINQFELPSEIRAFGDRNKRALMKSSKNRISNFDIADFLDGLSFPFLGSGLILAAHFTSAKTLFANRKVLNAFAENIGKFKHPKRLLWLTDTFGDKNGVSVVLQSIHQEIKKLKLPIDILVCSNKIQSDKNLIVLKPLMEFNFPFYKEQTFFVPDFLEAHQLFVQNEYDRIICSTEGIMGVLAIYLKNAFTVPASFYLHTDWITFAKDVIKIEKRNLNRFRRILRAFYKNFDSVFVLNTEQQQWLVNREMAFHAEQIHLTAHWIEDYFLPTENKKELLFNIGGEKKVLLFAGRLSEEKGVYELFEIYHQVKGSLPDLQLVFAGTGPTESKLRELLPEAVFLGWVAHNQLPYVYSSADLLVLPSKFDTFSCVVLEALSCGLPVVAYNTKGPKDIIQHNQNGYLANNLNEMVQYIQNYFENPNLKESFTAMAIERARQYTSTQILENFLRDIQLVN